MTGTARPSPMELWHEACGDGERYRQLMREHKHLLSPGDEGYGQGSRDLPCGWPGGSGGKQWIDPPPPGGNGGMGGINPFGPIAAHLRGLPVGWPEEDRDFAAELDSEDETP